MIKLKFKHYVLKLNLCDAYVLLPKREYELYVFAWTWTSFKPACKVQSEYIKRKGYQAFSKRSNRVRSWFNLPVDNCTIIATKKKGLCEKTKNVIGTNTERNLYFPQKNGNGGKQDDYSPNRKNRKKLQSSQAEL